MATPAPPPPPLVRLLYLSASRLDPDTARAGSELDAILVASRRNNARDGVTGVLLFAPRGFAQVLEGPPGAVAAAFGRIEADPRHGAATVLHRGPARARAFAGWAMGAALASADDLARLADAAVRGAATRGGDGGGTAGAAAGGGGDRGTTGDVLIGLVHRALVAAGRAADAA